MKPRPVGAWVEDNAKLAVKAINIFHLKESLFLKFFFWLKTPKHFEKKIGKRNVECTNKYVAFCYDNQPLSYNL